MALRLVLACVLGGLLLPQAAIAGGWLSSITLDRSRVAPGQRVEVDAHVAFRSVAAAKDAQETQQFYVYLLRGFDDSIVERAMREPASYDWWSLGDAEAIQAGRVTIRISEANFGRATARFTVPEVPPGAYHLMLCDSLCREPLADLSPTSDVVVVADPATAELSQAVDRLQRRITRQDRRLAAALRVARRTRSEVERLEVPVSPPAQESRTPLWAYAGWVVAGALLLLVLRRRPRRARWSGSPRSHRVDRSHGRRAHV